jgi:outer membrane protein assembly factor BamB
VVVDTGDQLQGYDPRAGETTWQDPVTRLPAAATVQDDTTVYLPPGAGGSDGIGRVDAATGRVLAPLQLPRAPRLDPASTELDGVGQGLLALGKTSAQPASSAPGQPIGYPIVLSVVVDSGTGATVWARNGNVAASDAGPFSTFDANSHTYTAVDPRTGQDLWSVSDPGLGTVGGPHPLVALPDYLVQGIEADPQDNGGEVAGVPPAGSEATHAAWHSVPLIRPQLVAVDQDTAVVSTCDPWANPVLSKLCADRALVAIAI